MRVLFALSGLHRFDRGAEIAFMSVANELAKGGDTVTLIGSGKARPLKAYSFRSASSITRNRFEHFPSLPGLRDECAYEDLTFQPALLHQYDPSDYDVTLTCSYPFTNWSLRRPRFRTSRPPHVFVTQNGDWPAFSTSSENRFFNCDGLICTNRQYFDRNKHRWRSQLIPNGVDVELFRPGRSQNTEFNLPSDRLIVLMVSALIPSKRVNLGLEAVRNVPRAHLVVAGDGPQRAQIESLASRLLPGRFTRLSLPAAKMPDLYRSVDVFLHLSKVESFGNVFLEAMASGVPIAAPDCSHIRWIVGENEFLFDSDDPTEIALEIRNAADSTSEQRDDRIDRAQSFSWTTIAKGYRDFLSEVIASTGHIRRINPSAASTPEASNTDGTALGRLRTTPLA